MKLSPIDQSEVRRGVAALKQGLLVAFPTETVYGLGADAANAEALKRLYEVKGRPPSHPVIVHLSSIEQLDSWASAVPEPAFRLAEKFWPGPLTLILAKAPHVLLQVTGGQASVGLRIPDHPLALALIQEFGGGVAAPSANRFGRLSATCASDVAADLGCDVAVILDGGPCEVGIESTIVDFASGSPQILRPGMILPEQIESVIGKLQRKVPVNASPALESQTGQPQARHPGGLPSHYAPATPLMLVPSQFLESEVAELLHSGKRLCLLSFEKVTLSEIVWLQAVREPLAYARSLYQNLRFLDLQKADLIIVESVPEQAGWTGIADRLARAAIK